MEHINLLTAMVTQMTGSPAFLYVLIFVNMVIFCWEAIPNLPSRLIPIVSIVLGGVLFPLVLSPGTVSPDFPNPKLVLIGNGLLAGLISFAAHAVVVAQLRSKLGWPPPPETKPEEKPKTES